jgi:phospholipid transport system transporter-binding protein
VASDATCRIENGTLHLAGALDRAAVVELWPQLARGLGPLRQLDLQAVERVDSAGLALLGEIAARLRANGGGAITGTPPGLDELRAAYRLLPDLDFNAPPAGR